MAAHQGPPSLGFSRQEHWSGLPFPSPMHESEKWKWSYSVMSNSEWLHGLQPTSSSVRGIFQTRVLKWGATAFSVKLVYSYLNYQNQTKSTKKGNYMDCSPPGPLSMEFSRQEYWSGLPFPSPGDLPDPGIELGSPEFQGDSLPSEPPGKSTNEYHLWIYMKTSVTKC